MIHKKIQEETVVKREILSHITCDLCDEIIEKENSYSTDEFTINIVEGAIWPEGDCSTRLQASICSSCSDYVKATLISIGVKFNDISQ